MLEFINVVKLGAGNYYNRGGFVHKPSSVCADLKQCRSDCSSGRLHFLDTQLETIRIRSQLSLCCRSIKNLRAQAGKVPSDAYFHTPRLQDFNLEFEYGSSSEGWLLDKVIIYIHLYMIETEVVFASIVKFPFDHLRNERKGRMSYVNLGSR